MMKKKISFKNKFNNNFIYFEKDDLNLINNCITNIINQNIDISNMESIKNLNISQEKISIENIIIFLLKLSLRFKNNDEFKNFLQNSFETMYVHSNRKIKKLFQTNIQDKIILSNLNNLSYILSFVLLVVYPGELLKYEYENMKENKNEPDIKLEPNYQTLKKKHDKYIEDIKKDKILNKDLIYYNGNLTLHEENDEFSKYERQILENDIVIDNNNEKEEDKEFFNLCHTEIVLIKNDINNNHINISNLISFLEKCEGILPKMPFILSKNINDEKIKNCIDGIMLIQFYLNKLIQMSIFNNKFGDLIFKYCYEFSYFIDKFLDTNRQISNNIHLDSIKKYDLFSSNIIENIEFSENKRNNLKNDFDDIYHINRLNSKLEMESYNSDLLKNNKKSENYENKKDLNLKIKEDKLKIFNQLKISENERKFITMEGINDEFKAPKNEENNENKEIIPLKNDLTEFEEELFESKDIRKLFGDLNNISATKFLKDIMKIVTKENQKYSIIKEINHIKAPMQKFDDSNNIFNSEFYISYTNFSSRLQNIISNLIRQKILIYNEKEILPKTLKNSYLDIIIDISATMSEDQRIASLLLTFGLSLSFSKYGVKIRISVFAERDNIWVLTENFSLENIPLQLSRLRDALSMKSRILSFPADALRKLKNSFFEKIGEKKYCQILISNLISSQIVDKKLNWNILGQRIIIFGLKSIFEEEFINKNKDIYENILRAPTSDQSQIIQEFFDSLDIISQFNKLKESFSKLINSTLDTILDINEEMEDYNIREIIINNNNYPKNLKNITIDQLKILINNNPKEKNYFSQNIPFSMINLQKFKFNKIPTKNNFPSISELKKLSSQNIYNEKESMDEIISFISSLLTPLFRQIMPSNSPSGKIPCTSGGSLSIQGIKKWICSGFTYTYIFEKQGGKNKKKYNLSYVLDLSKSVLLKFNYSHCIATIVLLLIAPSNVSDNDEIYIDIIINTIYGIKIVDFNSKCSIFQNINKINEIINIINEEINFSCCPGSCLYTAYKLLLERREDKKIFLITDGFVSDKNEIKLALNLIESIENEEIELVTIGVGTFPKGIKEICPNCCYASSIRNLPNALFSNFFYSKESISDYFEPNLVVADFDENIKKKLIEILNEKPKDTILSDSINNEDIDSYVNMIYNENSASLEGFEKKIKNPEEEPYYDVFSEKILIVILYLGNKDHDKNITTEIFEKNAGKSLKKKGFKYDLVYSYGDAIKKLETLENNNCPYSELWLFCSKGDGSLPDKAEDKDPNKISIFLEMVADFNKKGGSLFLFCDNYPFVLEANLLLKEYIKFEEGEINFEMKGSYNNKDPEGRFIFVKGTKNVKNGYFQPEHFLKCPGKANKRLSLRIGLNTFSEGITLSYAETFDNTENYRPFTPFAYLSDPVNKRPFILYYDPKVETGRGPIVVHGGFTSAFYDFEQTGTGRLVISIACWLIRKEEYIVNLREGIVKVIRGIKRPRRELIMFNKWIKSNFSKMYSIIILDVSGSMSIYYERLIKMANDIISKQILNKDNKGTIILFGTNAKTIIKDNYRLLSLNDIKIANVGTSTNFYNAFKEAEKYIYNKNVFTYKRILFLTDGISDSSKLQPICDLMFKENFQINIVGFDNNNNNRLIENYSSFEHLRKFASPNCFFTSNSFKEVETICQNIFAAE